MKGHKPVVEHDVLKWAKWFETGDRRVAFDSISKDIKISTVFLAIDNNFGFSKRPALFETLVYKPMGAALHEIDMKRYPTWEEAERGHQMFVMKYSKDKAVDAEIVKEGKNERLTDKKRKN